MKLIQKCSIFILVVLLATAGMAMGTYKEAQALSCAMPTMQERIDEAKILFVGKVTHVQPNYTAAMAANATFEVTKYWKGSVSKKMILGNIYAWGGSPNGEPYFKVGEQYLVFAASSEGHTVTTKDGLVTNITNGIPGRLVAGIDCSGTALLSQSASESIEEILGPGKIPTDQSIVASSFSRNLTVGMSGADVVLLQKALEAMGFLVMPQGVSKGYFGNATRAALAKYQMSVGISPAVGYFGPLTRAKMSTAHNVDVKTADTKIKSALSSIRAGAEMHYDNNNGSYAGLCYEGMINKSSIHYIQNNVTEILQAKNTSSQAAAGIKCAASAQAYAISVPLNSPGHTGHIWCVDSTGYSRDGLIYNDMQRCMPAAIPTAQ